jgi:hypothetical protein
MSDLKIECARRQLGAALALCLQDHDPVSVHCLAGGGWEVIEYYAKKAGAKPFSSFIVDALPVLKAEGLRKSVLRANWTAFKHATHQHSGKERDDDKLLSRFTDVENDGVLYAGWHDYAVTVRAMPVEAALQQAWFVALHLKELELDPKYREPYETRFPNLRHKSRAEQKRMLNDAIAKARAGKDEELMNHPAIEKRPLILDWQFA